MVSFNITLLVSRKESGENMAVGEKAEPVQSECKRLQLERGGKDRASRDRNRLCRQ